MANSFTATVNSSSSITSAGSWSISALEVPSGYFVSSTFLRIQFKQSTSSTWTTFQTGTSKAGFQEATVSRTHTGLSASTTYNFRLLQYYTYESLGGNGGL